MYEDTQGIGTTISQVGLAMRGGVNVSTIRRNVSNDLVHITNGNGVKECWRRMWSHTFPRRMLGYKRVA